MPNRLKSLELNGYKTFASKTFFEFDGDITAIVGPNGSGKSNIADALRWVLGEQSFRLLRGRRTDDMIFSGSQTRARAGMASATVTFDNSDGWLPIDFNEVSITRRAYRDSQNEYLINGQKVRLRDVNELLASSGLSERTYTVIGQGLVDAALTLKAEERRRLFEEAAGIGLYRSRKESALRRLDNTKRNLERVEDILTELSPRLRSLRRQASRAEEYVQVRDDLEAVLREWYGYHWHKAQKELQLVRADVAKHEAHLNEVRENQTVAEQSINELRDRINTLRSQLNSWHRQLSQIHTRREETSRELAVSDERRRALQEQEAQAKQEINRLEEEVTRYQTRLEGYQRRVDEARQTAAVAEDELAKSRKALAARREERRGLEDQVQAKRQEINRMQARRAELDARSTELTDRLERLEKELDAHSEQLAETQQTHDQQEKKLETADQTREQAAADHAEKQAALENIRQELQSIQEKRTELQNESAQLTGENARMQAELQVLQEAEESLAGYTSGAKVLLQAAKDGKLANGTGAFGRELQVPEALELAIAAALGDYVDAVLLPKDDDPEKALQLLDADPARAALLPLASISPSEPLADPKKAGCLGVAADLVEASAELRPVVDMLLGQVLVVKNRQTARQVLKGVENQVTAVTLKGEVFHGSGAIMVHSGQRAAALQRPRQQKSLQSQITEIEKKLDKVIGSLQKLDERETDTRSRMEKASGEIDAARRELRSREDAAQQARREMEKTASKLEWMDRQRDSLSSNLEQSKQRIESTTAEINRLDGEIQDLRGVLDQSAAELERITVDEQLSQVSYWEAQVSVGQEALKTAEQIHREGNTALEQAQKRLDEQVGRAGQVKARLVELDYQVQEMRSSEGGIGEEIQKLNVLIEPAEKELADLEALQTTEQGQETEVRQAATLAERHYAQAQISLARRQEALDTLRQRVEADFGLVEFEYTSDVPGPTPLPFGDNLQKLPHVEEISPELEDELKQKRLQLRRLGSVNPDAQREYKEVHERHEFLTNQVQDLEAAERDIRTVIAELDELMERDFKQTFEVVAREFKQVFARLFAGGSAKLVLTEADDLDDIGIDIEARLPGKRTQELALLSGGERSLTAAALVFALIKASPTPFCVMDEVDAMLDEANVGRFRQVLEELAADTQFVVITHNRHTVQAAEVIYGITMGRDTTSQTISLKLEDVDDRYSSN